MRYSDLSITDPDCFPVVIEIEKGSNLKYEYDEKSESFFLDFTFTPDCVFPYAYGFVPHTLCGDGDALDAFVLSHRDLKQGDVVTVRPIGYVDQLDRGEEDMKIITVDCSDTTFDSLHEIEDAGMSLQDVMRNLYARIAKQKNKQIEIRGFYGSSAAQEVISRSHRYWLANQPLRE